MLVIMIVSKERRSDMVFLKHCCQCGHVTVGSLAAADCGEWWMMPQDEPELRFLMLIEIFLKPSDLFIPIHASPALVRRSIFDIGIQYAEMRITPIEGIIRAAVVKNTFEVLGMVLVISQRWEKRRVPKQFLFDIEKDRPLRAVISIFDHVAALNNEIGNPALENLRDDAPMDGVTRTVIAVGDKLKRFGPCRRRLERAFTSLSESRNAVFVASVRLE